MSKNLIVLFVTQCKIWHISYVTRNSRNSRNSCVICTSSISCWFSFISQKIQNFFLAKHFHTISCTKIDPAYLITVFFSYVNSITHFFLCFYSHPLFLGQYNFEFWDQFCFPRKGICDEFYEWLAILTKNFFGSVEAWLENFTPSFFTEKKTKEGFKGRFAVGLSLFAGLHPQMESSTTSRRTLQLSE